jgi:hypothetical protein
LRKSPSHSIISSSRASSDGGHGEAERLGGLEAYAAVSTRTQGNHPASTVPTASQPSQSPDLKDHFNFYRGICGKGCHPHSGPRMLTDWLAKHLNHKVRKSVHHFRLVTKPSAEFTIPRTLTTRFT